MSPILQRPMSDLRLLSLEEQWKLLSYLVNNQLTEPGTALLREGMAEEGGT
jgi:hypothetical protein